MPVNNGRLAMKKSNKWIVVSAAAVLAVTICYKIVAKVTTAKTNTLFL